MAKQIESDAAREKRWRAEEDARILASYNEIMANPQRKKLAIKVAEQQANELLKRANALKKIANKGKK